MTDLDGTYLDQGRILPENEAQVRRVQRLGVRVMACTGRTWTMCDWLIPQLGFDEYAVTSNGASIVEGAADASGIASASIPIFAATGRGGAGGQRAV